MMMAMTTRTAKVEREMEKERAFSVAVNNKEERKWKMHFGDLEGKTIFD